MIQSFFAGRFARATGRAMLLLLSLSTLLAGPAQAELSKPLGRVILTVTGNISGTNAEGRAEFDQAMLAALGIHRFSTSTPWTDGAPEFEGVLLADVLSAVGARGERLDVIALNDYSAEIPLSDLKNYPVLLAWAVNGRHLTRRDKGPLWIMYPLDAHQELKENRINDRLVWQLTSVEVR
ncbi:MAG: molybdopterin-dependent oxidoreductase [Gammaproteobacteria bacterium]|nr:molybdopterin-dependent oxidoreductase [Gammaproteobacteria bacterium]